jgi:hypothetical protein
MLMSRRIDVWLEAQAANHELVPDDHLALDAFSDALDGYAPPVAMLQSSSQG